MIRNTNREPETNNDAAAALNELVGKNLDYADGYQAAASTVRDLETTSFVSELSRERKHWAGQLQLAVRALGGHPSHEGAGRVQRTWLELRAAVGSPEGDGLINAVRSAEERMLAHYEKALEAAPLPPELEEVLEAHRQALLSSIDKLERQDFEVD